MSQMTPAATVGDHSHANRRQHHREHFANGPAWQPLDHRMQLYAGRPADQWRGFAALDAGNSGEPATGSIQPESRSLAAPASIRQGRYADAEHVGMRRGHDEIWRRPARWRRPMPRAPRQRRAYRRRAAQRENLRKDSDAKRMLSARPAPIAILKRYLMVRLVHRAYFFRAAHRACPSEAVTRWPPSGRRTPRLLPPNEAGGAVRLSSGETDGSCRSLTYGIGLGQAYVSGSEREPCECFRRSRE